MNLENKIPKQEQDKHARIAEEFARNLDMHEAVLRGDHTLTIEYFRKVTKAMERFNNKMKGN